MKVLRIIAAFLFILGLAEAIATFAIVAVYIFLSGLSFATIFEAMKIFLIMELTAAVMFLLGFTYLQWDNHR